MASALRVGAHTSIAGGMYRALQRGAETGCDIIQVFTRPNQQWAAKPLTDEDVARWEAARAETGVEPAMAHSSYLINLATADRTVRDKGYRALADEYARCARLGIPNLVMHPGAHLGDGVEAGVARIAEAIDRLHDEHPENPTAILFENTAGQGSNIGHRFEELRDLLAAVADQRRVGVCIDTCHALAAGYDITTSRGWAATIDALDEIVGCDRVLAIHVNDSKRELGSRVDRHEELGRGCVGLTAFHCLVNEPRLAGRPMSIETPRPNANADAKNLAILRSLHGRRRVTPAAKRLAET